jgi:hypothetical protein
MRVTQTILDVMPLSPPITPKVSIVQDPRRTQRYNPRGQTWLNARQREPILGDNHATAALPPSVLGSFAII